MSKPPFIHSFLDCSTCHITKADTELLDAWAAASDDETALAPPYRVIKHLYGWFVHVRLEGSADGSEDADRLEFEANAKEDGISDAFFALQALAREHGCWWINLDADADTIETLPTHDW
jgi:hypothetical protein